MITEQPIFEGHDKLEWQLLGWNFMVNFSTCIQIYERTRFFYYQHQCSLADNIFTYKEDADYLKNSWPETVNFVIMTLPPFLFNAHIHSSLSSLEESDLSDQSLPAMPLTHCQPHHQRTYRLESSGECNGKTKCRWVFYMQRTVMSTVCFHLNIITVCFHVNTG